MKKNTAQSIIFPILDADGDLVTGATGLDSEVSIDAGEFTDCTNEATEIATNSGMYYLTLTADETNGSCIAIIVKTSSSGAKTTPLVFYTQSTNLDTIVADTNELQGLISSGKLPAQVKGLDDIDLSATMKTSVNAEVDTALNTAIPAVNTADSINDILLDTLGTDVWATAARTLTAHAFPFTNPAAPTALANLTVGTVTTLTTWDKAGYALSAAGIDSVWDEVIEGATPTARQAMRLYLSALTSKLSGAGTGTLVFRDYNDTKDRITATVDANNNRTAIVTDVT
jgi:hypothetical protein